GEEHAGAHRAHHLFVRERVLLPEQREAFEVEVREAGWADRSQIGAAALYNEGWCFAAEEVRLGEFDGRVATAGLDERQVAADQIREVDELVDVSLAGVSFVPGEH